jgi:hypothetical protein
MATTDNNLHIPDDLAADALKRYLAHEWLNRIEREDRERRRQFGLTSDGS